MLQLLAFIFLSLGIVHSEHSPKKERSVNPEAFMNIVSCPLAWSAVLPASRTGCRVKTMRMCTCTRILFCFLHLCRCDPFTLLCDSIHSYWSLQQLIITLYYPLVYLWCLNQWIATVIPGAQHFRLRIGVERVITFLNVPDLPGKSFIKQLLGREALAEVFFLMWRVYLFLGCPFKCAWQSPLQSDIQYSKIN